ncbi:MAG TPA: hypothetical protein VGD64_14660 [Acidisarcina sp.]
MGPAPGNSGYNHRGLIEPNRDAAARRATQSLVHTLSYCWSRPSLLALELAWRWLFGLPALAIIYWQAERVIDYATLAPTGIYEFNLTDPVKASIVLTEALRVTTPGVLGVAGWLLPLLTIGWAAASGVGRLFVLRRYDPGLPFWPLTLVALQLLRAVALLGTLAAWLVAMRWAAHVALGSTAADVEPNLILYLTILICISLGVFTLWALLSWVFSIAPLIALTERQTIAASLMRSVRLGRLSGKLTEVNLVLGIVKLALIVLAMVFSATPLPFQSTVNGLALYLWWGAVTLLYLAASDFFQVARLIAFLDLLQS